jgi:putative acetyltransferase
MAQGLAQPITNLPSRGTENSTMFEVHPDDLSSPSSRRLLELHLAGMHKDSPSGQVFALDLSGLITPSVQMWSAWHGDEIAAIGALKLLGEGDGEVKSMCTRPSYLRQGAGSVVLKRIIVEAKRRGLSRVSLETGSGEAFEAAIALYRKRGFRPGGPFSDYIESDFNQFLHLDLHPV